MLLLHATYRLPPEGIKPALAGIATVVEATRAEEGCLHYAYNLDVLDHSLLRITEVWRDRASLERHFTTPHLAAWAKQRVALGFTDREVLIYDHADAPEALP
jgi:quinol monooxygenase YgiN